jgi:hypothetical protein
VAPLPQSEREEKIIEWWTEELPNFHAEFIGME